MARAGNCGYLFRSSRANRRSQVSERQNMRFYRITVNANRRFAGWRLVNSTLDHCNRRKTVGSTALLSSLEHFRRLLHAMVCGVARRPPIGYAACTRAAPKTSPLGTVVFRYSRMNDLTNRDNAPHVPVPVYVYRFETRYTRAAGDEREVMHRTGEG